MPITIYALDNQFAAATGGNVNNGPGTSTFDYPPQSSSNLIITSQAGDSTPFIFSPGDTYTISFSGNGGTTIENATVLRSDDIDFGGDQGYAVVFEGIDTNGDLTQVVWTPEFDLETWYWDNFSGGNPPGFYTTDNSAVTYAAPCFTDDAEILTEDGMRAAGEITAGTRVLTAQNGLQPVLWAAHATLKGTGRAAPVRIEPDVLGNFGAVEVSQQHRVVLQGRSAAELHGTDRVLVPAMSLINGATVRLMPRDEVHYVHLLFARHEVICAQGLSCESLLLGRQTKRLSQALGLRLPQHLRGITHDPAHRILTRRQGEALWNHINRIRAPKRAMMGRRGKSRGAYLLPLVTGGAQPAYRDITGVEAYAAAHAAANAAAGAAAAR